jgi:hypothetical protein
MVFGQADLSMNELESAGPPGIGKEMQYHVTQPGDFARNPGFFVLVLGGLERPVVK